MLQINLIKIMKNTILLTLLLSSFFSFGQETITYKNGGSIFNSNNQKLSSSEINSLFQNNTIALNLYHEGKTKQTVGNILLYGGLGTIVGKFIANGTGDRTIDITPSGGGTIKKPSNTLFIVGGLMVVVAIPVKIGYSKKIKKSVELINEDFKNPKTGFSVNSTHFISNANGLGFSITF